MKSVQVSDELYDKLKSLVVDPFDDTAEIVISRLVEIVEKAKSRWSPLDRSDDSPPPVDEPMSRRTRVPEPENEEAPVIL